MLIFRPLLPDRSYLFAYKGLRYLHPSVKLATSCSQPVLKDPCTDCRLQPPTIKSKGPVSRHHNRRLYFSGVPTILFFLAPSSALSIIISIKGRRKKEKKSDKGRGGRNGRRLELPFQTMQIVEKAVRSYFAIFF